MDDGGRRLSEGGAQGKCGTTAYGCPRDFLDNRLVYVVISPRTRGLSIGASLNPDRQCNFDCVYCEVNDLNDSGAQIPLGQINSATRQAMNPACGHLPLQALSAIARTVRHVSGLRAEVF